MDYIIETTPYKILHWHDVDNVNNVLNHVFQKVKMVMKNPKLLNKIYVDENYVSNIGEIIVGLINHPVKEYEKYVLYQYKCNWDGLYTILNSRCDLLGAIAFPEYKNGTIIKVRIGNLLVNEIIIDEKKTYYYLIEDTVYPFISTVYHQITLECSEKIDKPIVMLGIRLDTETRKVCATNSGVIKSKNQLFTAHHGEISSQIQYTSDL